MGEPTPLDYRPAGEDHARRRSAAHRLATRLVAAVFAAAFAAAFGGFALYLGLVRNPMDRGGMNPHPVGGITLSAAGSLLCVLVAAGPLAPKDDDGRS